MSTVNVLALIAAERLNQERLFDSGALGWVASKLDCPPVLRLAALMEEVGEVARAVHDGESDERMIEELVQVAAVAVAWVEGIRAAQ